MFRVKICGVTTVQDALAVAEAGADAIGLNFYASSPRHVSLQRAKEIAETVPRDVLKVGVFVNAADEQIVRASEQADLDVIQLHGDEPPEALSRLGGRPVIRAFRCGDKGFGPLLEYVLACRRLGRAPAGVLVDAFRPHAYGGTGAVVDWSCVPELAAQLPDLPVILAGGLRPDNVAEAIRAARPAAVDTASGVESRPGRKDAAKVREFVQNALAAFAP